MIERRRHPRFDVEIPTIARNGGRLFPATMFNLSVGGAYIKINQGLIDNTSPIEIIFDLNDKNKDLSLMCGIRRVENEGIGVQFLNPFSEQHKLVRRYLAKN